MSSGRLIFKLRFQWPQNVFLVIGAGLFLIIGQLTSHAGAAAWAIGAFLLNCILYLLAKVLSDFASVYIYSVLDWFFPVFYTLCTLILPIAIGIFLHAKADWFATIGFALLYLGYVFLDNVFPQSSSHTDSYYETHK